MSEIAGIRPVDRPAGAPSPVEAAPQAQSPRPNVNAGDRAQARLDPAVTVDIGRNDPADSDRQAQAEYRGRYIKEPDSHQIVFQVIDPGTGTVMVQLPSPQAIEARTYAEAAAARAATSATVEARGQPVDRTA